MPEMSGLEVLEQLKQISGMTSVIMLTAFADKTIALRALKLGAFDFFEKPVSCDDLMAAITRTAAYQQLLKQKHQLEKQVEAFSKQNAEAWGEYHVVGCSPAVEKIKDSLRTLQQERQRIHVLVSGESGTGKDLIARVIHFGGARKEGPFVPVNCCALPEQLAESLLFGHIKGAFTGASRDVEGAFDQADGGTLFLDEIGDMPLTLQPKLLRVLEDGVVVPVGQSKGHKVDVCIVSATNASLEDKVARGQFRQDLYYRLCGYVLHLPPLRERRDDIPLFVDYFVRKLADEMRMKIPEVDAAVYAEMSLYAFPGNVRELRNIVERALLESRGGRIMPEHLVLPKSHRQSVPSPEAAGQDTDGAALPRDLKSAEIALIKREIKKAQGNISEAAAVLGISRAKIYRKLNISA